MTEPSLCSFCNAGVESLTHLQECRGVQGLLDQRCPKDIQLDLHGIAEQCGKRQFWNASFRLHETLGKVLRLFGVAMRAPSQTVVEDLERAVQVGEAPPPFAVNDRVRVVHGDLANRRGSVREVTSYDALVQLDGSHPPAWWKFKNLALLTPEEYDGPFESLGAEVQWLELKYAINASLAEKPMPEPIRLKTLPLVKWTRTDPTNGVWSTDPVVSPDGKWSYQAMALRINDIDGWAAHLTVNGSLVHSSEHGSRNDAQFATQEAFRRAIALREVS